MAADDNHSDYEDGAMPAPVTVFVSSLSPIKIDAVREALGQSEWEATEITGFAAASGVDEQPVGNEDTLRGAMNRLAHTKSHVESSVPEARGANVLYVAMENGIFSVAQPDGTLLWFDLAWIVVEHGPTGRRAFAHSEGIQFPTVYVEKAQRLGFARTTVGSVIASETTASKADPHMWLTRGQRPRFALLTSAIGVALSQLPAA
eukprot:c2090_g1_i1.p2 GENE.c2090_g1_i1~~c2090_g1_i1.p2  ORF type:complete len:204 (+),score=31.06 c2090_g1_i1:25-636(+)